MSLLRRHCLATHANETHDAVRLVPAAIDRAVLRKRIDRARRSGKTGKIGPEPIAEQLLEEFAKQKKSYVQAQYLATRRTFERQQTTGVHEATFSQAILEEFEELWRTPESRLAIIPGKEALSALNFRLQSDFSVNVTPTSIVDAMTAGEIPKEVRLLIADLEVFSAKTIVDGD